MMLPSLHTGAGTYERKLDDLLRACHLNLSSVDDDLIRRAYWFSFNAHKNDFRASGELYFNHPYNVALIIAREVPLDDISVAAALLHDVVEDTEFELKDVRAEFGDTIAEIVDGVTKITDIFRGHEITQAENYRKMLLSMVHDVRVMLVKLADRLHNMRTLDYLPSEKRLRLAKETLELYAPFAHRFGLANIKWELEDLAFKYLYPEKYDELKQQISAKRREREHYIRRFIAPIEERLKAEGYKFEISGRPKNLYSIYNKMVSRNKPLDEIYDLFAIRIILDTQNNTDCFAVYGIVSEIYIPIPERFKNYISVPKKNGYQSIHTTVIGPEGKMVEVQIRTREMHEVAERGVAAHWKYKENIPKVDKELEEWTAWVREIFEPRSSDEAQAKQVLESFKLHLYQEEIYVFTPKGDLKILPRGATPVDFAFEIHSDIGYHCIGAKVNGRIVPLNAILHSGDQVEIITSKNQTPSADWEKFVVTHKAKAHLRRWMKEEARLAAERGKEIWERKLKRHKVHLTDEDYGKILKELKLESRQALYTRIAHEQIDPDEILRFFERSAEERAAGENPAGGAGSSGNLFTQFVRTARDSLGSILIYGQPASAEKVMHTYAKCCNPVPGDEIVGFVTIGEGIKIHRKTCQNLERLRATDPDRVVEVNWPPTTGQEFLAGIRVAGEDRPGMLNEITHAISSYNNTNIRAVNLDTHDSLFEGSILIFVKDIEHLNHLLDRIRKIKGVLRVERLEE